LAPLSSGLQDTFELDLVDRKLAYAFGQFIGGVIQPELGIATLCLGIIQGLEQYRNRQNIGLKLSLDVGTTLTVEEKLSLGNNAAIVSALKA